MKRFWADYTRVIKNPVRGVRALSKNGNVLEHNGKKWERFIIARYAQVAVLSTGKLYKYDGKRWKIMK